MEDSIVGVQRDRALSTGVNVVGTQQSPWTVRKILILVPLFLVYFVVFAAYSVYAPFFPSEVSIIIRSNMAFQTTCLVQAPVVQRPDNFIQWISHYSKVSICAKISVFPLVQANMHTLPTAKSGSVRKPWTTFNVKYILDPE